ATPDRRSARQGLQPDDRHGTADRAVTSNSAERTRTLSMTIDAKRLTRVSKYLSLHLRHRPDALGLTLKPGGWVRVDELLRAAARRGFTISRDELHEVVDGNDKQRFAFDEGGTLIRANQGHSVEIDLELEPMAPPSVLYHGTGHRAVSTIFAEGLRKM